MMFISVWERPVIGFKRETGLPCSCVELGLSSILTLLWKSEINQST